MSLRIWDRRLGLKVLEGEEAFHQGFLSMCPFYVSAFPSLGFKSRHSLVSRSLDACNVPHLADAARTRQHLQLDWVN